MIRTLVYRGGTILGRSCYANSNYFCKRNIGISGFLSWVVNIFNSVDSERLKLVGPDFTCAEWLLRNGASVRFKGHTERISDYNELIAFEDSCRKEVQRLEEIYANDAYLTSAGFEHLKNCDSVKKITIIKCPKVGNFSVKKLAYVSGSLQHLEIHSCPLINDDGVLTIKNLTKLNNLVLANLSVQNKEKCIAELKKVLHNCNIQVK